MNNLQGYNFVEDKNTDEWRKLIVDTFFKYMPMRSLTHGKNVPMIDDYISGDINMKPFMKFFKSIKDEDIKKYDQYLLNSGFSQTDLEGMRVNDKLGQLSIPLMTQKINAAVNQLTDQEFEIEVRAIDSLANKKKDRDIEYLKKVPMIKEIKQGINDKMGFGEAEVDGTKYAASKMKEVPLDLDLTDSQDMRILKDIIYKLAPESASETILQYFYELKGGETVRNLSTFDQIRVGASAVRCYQSRTTGFFELEYIDPSKVYTTASLYPDFRDANCIRVHHSVTAVQLMNMFAGQIQDEETLKEIINGERGYCECNKINKMNKGASGSLSTQPIELVEFQVVAGDWIYIDEESNMIVTKSGEIKETNKKYFQNTYKFYWLLNTQYYFGAEILGFAHRKKGNEIYNRFDIHLWRSARKSIAEQCVGANKAAQMAYIKLMWEIVKAAPNGKYIDLKYIRNAAQSFLGDGVPEEEIQSKMLELVNTAVEDNIHVGDSGGFDGANEGQFKPVTPIPGGLSSNINSYISIIREAEINISRWTGINDDIAGVNSNPDMLNFARKSSIIQGLNSMKHIQVGIQDIFQRAFNTMFYCLKNAIEKNGVERKVIEDIIGIDKAEAIDGLKDIGEHTFFLNISLGKRDMERQENIVTRERLEARGLVTALDKLIINSTKNPKDQALLLAVIERKAQKKLEEQQQQQMQSAQQIQDSRNQLVLQAEQAKGEGKIKNTYAEGEVKSQLLDKANQLTLTQQEKDALLKRIVNKDRYDAKMQETAVQLAHKDKQQQEQLTAPLR
jgi:hypothetical protein